MPATAGWICESDALPAIKWASTTDRTGWLPGWTCSKLETPLPGTIPRQWLTWGKIAQLIEDLP